MEKKIPSRTEILKPVTVYLDDLEQIFNLLKSFSEKVYIETNEYKYETLDELVKNNKDVIHDLRLACGRYSSLSDIEVLFKPYILSLHIIEDIPASRGVFEKIKEILLARKQTYKLLASRNVIIGFTVAYLALIITLLVLSLPGDEFIILGLNLVAWTALIWLFRQQHKYSTIVLKHHSNQNTFFIRNKDQVLLLILGTIIGAVMTILTQLIITSIK